MDFVTLISFSELKDAMPYAIRLSEAGIQHRISEEFTGFDPTFAGNRRMDQVKLEVPESEHEAALQVIANIEEGADLRVITSPRRSGPPSGVWIAIVAVLLLCTLYFANRGKGDVGGIDDDPHFYYKQTSNSRETIRKDNQEMVSEAFDANDNKIHENGNMYTDNGDLKSSWFDRDENGTVEEWRMYDRLGRWATSLRDEDQDGFFEMYIEHRPEGDVSYLDKNGDGYFDPDEKIKEVQRTE